MVHDLFCLCLSHQLFHFLPFGQLQPVDALKGAQQTLGCFWTYPVNALQTVGQHASAASIPVVGDAKTMRLIAKLLQDAQGL